MKINYFQNGFEKTARTRAQIALDVYCIFLADLLPHQRAVVDEIYNEQPEAVRAIIEKV